MHNLLITISANVNNQKLTSEDFNEFLNFNLSSKKLISDADFRTYLAPLFVSKSTLMDKFIKPISAEDNEGFRSKLLESLYSYGLDKPDSLRSIIKDLFSSNDVLNDTMEKFSK
ncbi:hypothetical protein [Vibrio owensii]|uniref:hypothetical protein n=1 Tax=Vibrio harveyi group TaxID=717610 RepID=UPI003CC56852